MSMNGFASHAAGGAGGLDESNFGEAKGGVSVKSFDAFPKTKQTYLTATSRFGGIYTILIGLVCAYLTVTEFGRWMKGTTHFTYAVEKGIAHELQINLDIVVAMKCSDVHVNVQDAAGDWIKAADRLNKDPTLFHIWSQPEPEKERTAREKRERKLAQQRGDDWQGPTLGEANAADWAAYRAQIQQYSKEEDVHTYLNKAGRGSRKFKKTPRLKGKEAASDACRIYGSVDGNKVQGDFHITAKGHGYQAMGEHVDHSRFNFSHQINELSFGPFFPNIHNPLDATRELTDKRFYKYQYFVSVVPTIYTDKLRHLEQSTPPHLTLKRLAADARRRKKLAEQGQPQGEAMTGQGSGFTPADRRALKYNPFALSPHTIYTNQYAVTQQGREVSEQAFPGIYLKYDIEPILLTVSEDWGGVFGLLVRCVTVIAGVCAAGAWLVRLGDWFGNVVGARARRRAASLGYGGGGLLFGAEKTSME